MYLQAITGLLVVFGLLAFLYVLGPRLGGRLGGPSPRRIQILERVSLGDKRALLLVRVGEESFLVGSTSQQVQLVAPVELDEESGVPEGEPEGRRPSFRRWLEGLR